MKKILTFLFCVFSLLTISSCQIVSVGSLDDSVEDVSDDNSEIIDDTNDESDIILNGIDSNFPNNKYLLQFELEITVILKICLSNDIIRVISTSPNSDSL